MSSRRKKVHKIQCQQFLCTDKKKKCRELYEDYTKSKNCLKLKNLIKWHFKAKDRGSEIFTSKSGS